MTQHTHQTAPTQFAEVSGIRFAYRRFGKPLGVPLRLQPALHWRITAHAGVDVIRLADAPVITRIDYSLMGIEAGGYPAVLHALCSRTIQAMANMRYF
jgi:hypothetical protein